MSIYISLIVFVFIFFLYSYKRPNIFVYKFVVIAVSLIICFGYMCGSDWRSYEEIYTSYNDNNFWWRFLYVEPLYLCTNIIGNALNLNFWIFYISIKLLIFYKVIAIIRQFCPYNLFLLALTFYLGFGGIMVFIDPPFRNMIAVYLFLCSINYIIKKDVKKYLLFVLIASLFHYSAIILLLFYFVFNKTYSTRNILVCFLLINIILLKADWVFQILSKIFFFIPAISLKIDNYTVGEEASTLGQGKILSIGYLLHVIMFILILYSRKKIESMNYGKFLFNLSVSFIFVFRLGLTILIFSRLQLYLSCFYAIVVACLLHSFLNKYRLAYVFFILIISISSVYKQMASVFMVPYTNYFFYYNSGLSFDERSQYNFRYSPYKK